MLTSGCASYGSHLSATPLSPGQGEVSVSADVLIIDRGFGPQVVPNPELGVRRGISDRSDVGARVNAGGVEANHRFRVVSARRVELTLVSGVAFGFVPVTNADSGTFDARVLGTLLAGLALSERAQLVVGARWLSTYAFPLTAFRGEASGARLIHSLGGVLGLRQPVGETTYLFPEVNVLVPYDTERREWYFPSIQAGASLHFE